jgi:hypothetical protein
MQSAKDMWGEMVPHWVSAWSHSPPVEGDEGPLPALALLVCVRVINIQLCSDQSGQRWA